MVTTSRLGNPTFVPSFMSARYTRLPNPPAPDAERELDDAFGPDNEGLADDDENTPLNPHSHPSISPAERPQARVALATLPTPGVYDFERDYDYPPPGSPPSPSALALPNDFGNSNGSIPSSPVGRVEPAQPSLFRRLMSRVLPNQYSRLATEAPGHVVGGGTENDGVFANVAAKPQRARVVTTEDGEAFMVPEEVQKEGPPVRAFPCLVHLGFLSHHRCAQSYADAQADAVPQYWETTVHTPAGLEPGADMIIEDLPSGSVWVFFINLFISFFFQFVGFLLSYLLHTTHAAKYGSRAGLGLTLIQYGFYSRTASVNAAERAAIQSTGNGQEKTVWYLSGVDNSANITVTAPSPQDQVEGDNVFELTAKDWLSFLLMTLGEYSTTHPSVFSYELIL
jgi:hypothetical protein